MQVVPSVAHNRRLRKPQNVTGNALGSVIVSIYFFFSANAETNVMSRPTGKGSMKVTAKL